MIVARTIVSGITGHFRTRLSEWLVSGLLAVFGFRLLGPGETFSSSPSYAFLAHFATEVTWGYVIVTVAGLRLTALGINGSVPMFAPYSPLVRSLTAWGSAVVWCCLGLGFYRASPDGTAWSTYSVLCLADVSLAILIAGEAAPGLRRTNGARS